VASAEICREAGGVSQHTTTLFLPIYFLLFFGFAFLWQARKTYRLTGVNPYRVMSNPGPEEVTSRYFRLKPFLSFLVLVMYLRPEGNWAKQTLETRRVP
jgi:hypothetical protein